MTAERHRLVKLVRDGVERFLDGNPTIEYRPIPVAETLVEARRKKPAEEAAEYLLDPSIGELADDSWITPDGWRVGRTGKALCPRHA